MAIFKYREYLQCHSPNYNFKLYCLIILPRNIFKVNYLNKPQAMHSPKSAFPNVFPREHWFCKIHFLVSGEKWFHDEIHQFKQNQTTFCRISLSLS